MSEWQGNASQSTFQTFQLTKWLVHPVEFDKKSTEGIFVCVANVKIKGKKDDSKYSDKNSGLLTILDFFPTLAL